MEITQELLNERFYYDKRNGGLYNKKTNTGYRKNEIAGSIKDGYMRVKLYGKSYYVHRLIWFMFHGSFPEYIDHVNGNGLDNRIENLRNVTMRKNAQNRHYHRSGKLVGAYHNKYCTENPWECKVLVNGKNVQLGYYPTEQKAHEIYTEFVDFIEEEKRDATHTEVIHAG